VTSEAGRLTVAADAATGIALATGAGTVTTFSAALSMLPTAGATGGLVAGAGVGETAGATLMVSLTSLTTAADFA